MLGPYALADSPIRTLEYVYVYILSLSLSLSLFLLLSFFLSLISLAMHCCRKILVCFSLSADRGTKLLGYLAWKYAIPVLD